MGVGRVAPCVFVVGLGWLVVGWWLADFFGGLSVVLYGFCGGWLVFFWNGVNFWGGCPIVSVVPVDIGSVGQSEKDKLK